MPFIIASDHCEEDIYGPDDFDHDITEVLHIAGIATGVETNFESKRNSTAAPKPAPLDIKTDVDPVMPGKVSRPEIPPAPKRERIPFKQLFLPKFRLCRILLSVDPAAAWIICFSVIANGLMKTWSLACQYKAMTAFQEAILARNLESKTIIPILVQQFVVEFGLHMAIYAGLYGHKRYKKKMEKHLTEMLLEGYGALPYAVRIDRYIQKRYNAATIVPARAAVGLRSFATILVFFIEWVFDVLFVTHFVIFEAHNRRFVGITLLFFIGLTFIKILNKWTEHKSSTYRRLRQFRKGRAYRRCDEIVWGFHLEKGASRDTILYDLPRWQVREYGKAMDARISRSKASMFSRVIKKTDILESLYWVSEKIGLSFIVVYFNASISLGNYNMLEKRLFSICAATSTLTSYLFMEGYEDEWLRQYFELVDLGMKTKKENEIKRYTASLSRVLDPFDRGLEVELKDVSFAYPTQSEFGIDEEDKEFGAMEVPPSPSRKEFALRHFSFKFERGKMYSIVGQNGAGKTTLVQLLTCLYPPTSGSIAVNGRDILDYDPQELRNSMSVLFQDFSHFEFLTARETIEIGNIHCANMKRKAECLAEETGVTDFVPLGTVLFDISGVARDPKETWQSDLSGGQWQKIGLARSLMRDDAGLLILDEPTSALDVEAEHNFFNQILQRRRGKTTIFITHKFNTTRNADCILFIKDGRVWESGSHQELLKLNGEYARLYKLQSGEYLY